MIPGEYFLEETPIQTNAGTANDDAAGSGSQTVELEVRNRGDRPIQVGSHYHFFETNPALAFERERARGMRLDIPAGTGARFEPGELKKVRLTAIGGARAIFGHRGVINGTL